ncbi:hypothetical protein FDC27_09905 [Clostridium botulinum]|uniref:AIPR family protein n=1 Tax=Clostridium botulinum TaxID=1491 RepID=UPI0013C860CC|nr:AIPR family protein [Clostridium botulinum]MBY7025057.1 hypothetical protein [Clostridium botulinum]NFE73837.1 hypothetical protein [Clostridium botulinum]NFG26059.1 hypothetical protein [Clostridium botulinum]NFL60530.1 hypothetical protein [Clostridium botulinum]NFL63754.1 hypothetical protein [Clostridium botulinum]
MYWIYIYTEAGSNPREFQGMTSTNIKILKSILEDNKRFWAKHLGICLTIKSGSNEYDKSMERGILQYEDACITNGLQTLSLFRILLMIKIFQRYKLRDDIHKKITKTIENSFKEIISEILPYASDLFFESINILQINKVLYWIHKKENKRYLKLLNELDIDELLNIRISFKAVLLDEIVDDDENYLDSIQKWGGDIADSNNETQNVKEDDKFGTKYKQWFRDNIMKNIDGKIVDIEYRKYSIDKDKLPVKHILQVLRVIMPTTLIVDYKSNDKSNDKYGTNPANMISKYANNRAPVFNFFEKWITIANGKEVPKEVKDSIEIIKNLMPKLTEKMLYFENELNNYYSKLTFEEVAKSTTQNEHELKKRLGVDEDEINEAVLNRAVTSQLRFSSSNVFPLMVFATRTAIKITERLKVEYDIEEKLIKGMIPGIYKILLKQRLARQYGSTSDMFRDAQVYIDSEEIYKMKMDYTEQIDYTEKYRINLADMTD